MEQGACLYHFKRHTEFFKQNLKTYFLSNTHLTFKHGILYLGPIYFYSVKRTEQTYGLKLRYVWTFSFLLFL